MVTASFDQLDVQRGTLSWHRLEVRTREVALPFPSLWTLYERKFESHPNYSDVSKDVYLFRVLWNIHHPIL